jgi:hypothetical protein
MRGPLMSSISELSKSQVKQIDATKRKQERELKFIRDTHETVKGELKKAQDADISELRREHQSDIGEAETRKAKILQETQNNLQNTKTIVDKQIHELKGSLADEKNKLENHQALERERLISDNEIHLEDVHHRYQTLSKRVTGEGQDQLSSKKQEQAELYNLNAADFDNKIQQQREHFSTTYERDHNTFEKAKNLQLRTNERQRLEKHKIHLNEMEKLTRQHETDQKIKDEAFRRDVTKKEDFFEKKYTAQRSRHEGNFQNLESMSESVVSKAKADIAQQLKIYTDRKEDPFYDFTELSPVLKDLGDSIEVKVQLPPHAKSDLHLTFNQKDVILNFNRRYVDVRKEGDLESRINKVETMSSQLNTGAHLDPKSLKSFYEDGTMTYTIKKA